MNQPKQETQRRLERSTIAAVALCLFLAILPLSAQTGPSADIGVTVIDDASQPLAGVRIEVHTSNVVAGTSVTDSKGRTTIHCSPPATTCAITASLPGYLPLQTSVDVTGKDYQLQLVKALQHNEVVNVQAEESSPLATSQSGENKLPVAEANLSALRPATLIDALPLVPGVIRTPDGQVNITGLGEAHSVMIVNAVDVTDPATGRFGLSVPVDSVQNVKVLESPYLAEYGNFTAGVVSAETRRGGDKWDYSLNDPLPEFRFRSGHLVGMSSATPRFNVSGPLISNHLYGLAANEFIMHKNEVRTLPFPVDENKITAFNSFTQFDAPLTSTQALTVTLHFAPQHIQYTNLNFFDPEPVTPNADYQENAGTLTHHAQVAQGLITSTVAYTRIARNVDPQTPGPMTLSPVGDSGRYFTQQAGNGTRVQWMETWEPKTLSWHGQHALQAGAVFAHAEDEGSILSRTVTLNDANGNLVQTITYSGSGAYALADWEPAVYLQDHWIANERLAFDAGLRWEAQSITSTNRVAPRAGFTWTPSKSQQLIVRGGMGVFFDHVPLNIYAFPSYPQQTVTTYDGAGNIIDGPRLFQNIVSTQPIGSSLLVDQEPTNGNFAPHSLTWTIEGEQNLQSLKLRLRYMESDEYDQLTLGSEVAPGLSALVLGGAGSGRIRQLEFTSGLGRSADRHFYFSYVRQYSRGTLTDVSGYLGTARYPVVRSLEEASNTGEIPNRFLFWGTSTLPHRMRISPHVEYRDGFTYQPTNVYQQYVAPFNNFQPRYPRYFSLDARLSKDVNIGSKHAVRFSLNGINLTNHSNFLQVHNNVADPQFGTFFGTYGRHVLLDFDFLH